MTMRKIGLAIVFTAILAQAHLSVAEDKTYIIEPPDILKLEVVGTTTAARSTIEGEHLVRPDGSISLGTCGTVRVSGMTIRQARTAIAKALAPYAHARCEVAVHVELFACNSKAYYIVAKDKVRRFSLANDETAVGAVLKVEGLAAAANKSGVRIARPMGTTVKTMDVDWRAITQEGRLATNHKLQSGDRIYVGLQ
jgi:polysaccharide export outer membrane protein